MQALTFDGNLTLREVDTPCRQPDEALIQVTLAGICGTDLEILKGYSGFRGIPGHEFVGRVVETDEERWRGKRVVGEINVACGHCDWCRRGLARHCPHRSVVGIVNRDGIFAEFVALPLRNLHEVPDGIPDEAAVFVEPLAAAAEILEQMTIELGTRVVVIGDGRLGLLVAQVLKEARAEVTVLGRHAWKLDLARSWGFEVIRDGEPELPPSSFPVVVDATGSPRGIHQALRLVEPRGTVVMKSTFHGSADFDATKLVVDEVTLLGSRCGNFSTALEILRRGSVVLQPLISRAFPFEKALEAFDYVQHNSCLKVLLAFNRQG